MFDEKLETLQGKGGENELEELIFDLQRFTDDGAEYGGSEEGEIKESTDPIMSKDASELSQGTETQTTVTAQETNLSNSSVPAYVAVTGSGTNNIKFGTSGGNIAYITDDATGTKNVTLGSGGDSVVFDGGDAKVNIMGGKGEDVIAVRGSTKNVGFDMKSGGADKVYLAFNSAQIDINLSNYSASTDAGIVTGDSNTNEIVAGIVSNRMAFGNGVITLGANDGDTNYAKVTFNGNNDPSGSTFFNLYAEDGEAQAVGFTHKSGGTMNVGTNNTTDFLLIGNSDNSKNTGSTITGGKGNDTVLAGGGDVINAGAGSNQVILDTVENRDGAAIAMTAGRTTIENFHGGFGDTGDVLALDLINSNVTFSDGTLNIKGNGFRGQAAVTAAETSDYSSGTYAEVRFTDGTREINAAIANGDATMDASTGANYFKGNGDAVNFANVDGDVYVNLTADWNSTINGAVAGFNGITQFQGGDTNTTLWTGAANETLTAGKGDTSLYGAGGKNVLNGYDNSSGDKDSRTTFFVLGNANGASNTVTNFQFADTASDQSVADVLEIDANTNLVSDVRINGTGVVVDVSNRAGTATEKVLIEGALGRNFYVTKNVIAQVNNNEVIYDGQANFFVAKGANASVNVANSLTNTAEIWLDGKPNNGLGKNFVGDIKYVDASLFTGKAELAGSANTNNTIIGGAGQNSLWGGNGAEGNDYMQGGTGTNVFFYTNGNGNDTIAGANSGDVVYLSEVSIDQLASTGVSDGTAVINFKDGGSLTVGNAENCQFVMTQGDQAQVYKVQNGQFVAG